MLLNNETIVSNHVTHYFSQLSDSVPPIKHIVGGMYCATQVASYKDITLMFYGNISNCHTLSEFIVDEAFDNPDAVFPNEDTRLVIYLYVKYGIEHTLKLLEGKYLLVLLDQNINVPDSKMYVARDALGWCPLYTLVEKNGVDKKLYGVANSRHFFDSLDESKVFKMFYAVEEFPSGTYLEFTREYKVLSNWHPTVQYYSGHSLVTRDFRRDHIGNVATSSDHAHPLHYMRHYYLPKLRFLHYASTNINPHLDSWNCIRDSTVEQLNIIMNEALSNWQDTQSPVVVLDGNLSSCILVVLLKKILKERNFAGRLITVVLDRNEDAVTQKIADFYDTDHYMLDCIGRDHASHIFFGYEVFSSIELKNRDIIQYDAECRNAVQQFARAPKSAHYVDGYYPFLHETFLEYYFSIPLELRAPFTAPEEGIKPFAELLHHFFVTPLP
jgi:hypothetical protein